MMTLAQQALVAVTQTLVALGGAIPIGPEPATLHVEWKPQLLSPHPAKPQNSDEATLLAACGKPDQALFDVASIVAKRKQDASNPLTTDELTFALRAAGDPHLWPKSWSITGEGIEVAEVDTLVRKWITGFPTLGERRCGVVMKSNVATVITLDALADMSPVPTQARLGQWITIEGTMLVPAEGVRVVLLGPRAAPKTVPSSLGKGRFRTTFSVDQPGEWLVQVLATLATGPKPILEATIFAGQPPNTEYARPKVPGEEAAQGERDNAEAMLRMLNAARKTEGLAALQRSKDLDKLALAHCEEMMRSRLVAHDVGGGDPRTRIEAAGLLPSVAGENVASASTLVGAHRVLWSSPSHRGNLLHADYRKVGVAVTQSQDGAYWVTELFTD